MGQPEGIADLDDYIIIFYLIQADLISHYTPVTRVSVTGTIITRHSKQEDLPWATQRKCRQDYVRALNLSKSNGYLSHKRYKHTNMNTGSQVQSAARS